MRGKSGTTFIDGSCFQQKSNRRGAQKDFATLCSYKNPLCFLALPFIVIIFLFHNNFLFRNNLPSFKMLAFYTVLHLLLLFLQALPLNAAPESTSELCITERASIFYDVIPTSTRTVIKIISVVVEETITPAVTDAEDDFRWVFKPLSTRTVVKTITSAPVTTFTGKLRYHRPHSNYTHTRTETTTTTTYKGDSRNFRWSIFYMTTATTTVPAPPGFRRPTPALVGKRDGHKLRQADARHSDVADSSNQMIVDVHRKRAPAPCRVICTAFTTVNVTSTRTVLGALTATVPIGPATATLTGHRGGRVSTVVIPHDVLVPATTTVIEPTTITATVTKTEEKL